MVTNRLKDRLELLELEREEKEEAVQELRLKFDDAQSQLIDMRETQECLQSELEDC